MVDEPSIGGDEARGQIPVDAVDAAERVPERGERDRCEGRTHRIGGLADHQAAGPVSDSSLPIKSRPAGEGLVDGRASVYRMPPGGEPASNWLASSLEPATGRLWSWAATREISLRVGSAVERRCWCAARRGSAEQLAEAWKLLPAWTGVPCPSGRFRGRACRAAGTPAGTARAEHAGGRVVGQRLLARVCRGARACRTRATISCRTSSAAPRSC